MTIDRRDLAAGTKLATRYKGITYTAEVVQTDAGISYRTDDDHLFTSLSKAGSHIMQGISCNGWRFWSLEEDLPAPRTGHTDRKERARKPPRKAHATRQLRRLPNQKALTTDQSRWWCSACMASFIHEGGNHPGACPNGHPMEAPDEATMA